MFNLAISIGAAILFAILLWTIGVSPWAGAPLGLLLGGGLFYYLAKRVRDSLDAIFKVATEQLKRRHLEAAIQTMKSGYKWSRWQIMVKSAIDAQIGGIQYMRNKPQEAEPLLKSAGINQYTAKAMLAILQWKRGEKANAKKTFDLALKAGKKDSIMYALYAYVLNEMHEKDEAIKVLDHGLKYCKGDERLLDNRTLLQNKKPMKMKKFGEQWYQFLLERRVIHQEPPPFARFPRR
ncbi:MAG: hypothetical protein LBC63_02170 [Holophagales bacterium]|nr:hypothetical protein [Holophagales bacterium]